MNTPHTSQHPYIHAIFGNIHLRYIVDKQRNVIVIESFSGNPEMSGAFWDDIRKEIAQYLRGGYTVDCTSIQNPESFWSQKFIEKMKAFTEGHNGGKAIKRCDLQTGLPVEYTTRSKILDPNAGILGM
ncbi:MAG: hypothetical protein PHY14_00800 [Candidatus Gracilibacteria bacterium]|nr:hypothetical protein [Candidatus Gracilibacteria bacterium]